MQTSGDHDLTSHCGTTVGERQRGAAVKSVPAEPEDGGEEVRRVAKGWHQADAGAGFSGG